MQFHQEKSVSQVINVKMDEETDGSKPTEKKSEETESSDVLIVDNNDQDIDDIYSIDNNNSSTAKVNVTMTDPSHKATEIYESNNNKTLEFDLNNQTKMDIEEIEKKEDIQNKLELCNDVNNSPRSTESNDVSIELEESSDLISSPDFAIEDLPIKPMSKAKLKELLNENVYLISSNPTNGDPFSTIPPPKHVLSVHETITEALSNGLTFQSSKDIKFDSVMKPNRQSIEPSSALIHDNLDSLLYSTFHPPNLTTVLKTTELYEKIGIFVDWRSVITQNVKLTKPTKKPKSSKSKANVDHTYSVNKRKNNTTNITKGGRKRRKVSEDNDVSLLVDDRSLGYDEIDIISTSNSDQKPYVDKNDQSVALLLSNLSNIKAPTQKKKPVKKSTQKKDNDYKESVMTPTRPSRSSRSKPSRRTIEVTDFEFLEGWTGEVVMVKQSSWPWWPALVIRQDYAKTFGNWGQKPPLSKGGFRIPVFHLFDINGIGQAWITDKLRVRHFKHMNTPEFTELPETENHRLFDSPSALDNFRRAITAARLHLLQSEEGLVEHKPELPDDLPVEPPSDFELSIIKKADKENDDIK